MTTQQRQALLAQLRARLDYFDRLAARAKLTEADEPALSARAADVVRTLRSLVSTVEPPAEKGLGDVMMSGKKGVRNTFKRGQ